MRVVATAGHVDHGKSSLVLALTGTDPDRFEEEKRRGLTIDLGFAHTTLPSGEAISFIDVPGHVRFLRNMLAGVGEVEVEAAGGDTAVVRWTFDLQDETAVSGLSVLTLDGSEIVAETVYYDCAQSPVPNRCANMG